jgi:hypothetical protein
MIGGKGLMKRNAYLIFAYGAFRLLLIVAILDFAIGKALRYFYFREKVGREYRATFSIDKTNADILVFGASRAYQHYDPIIIQDSLKMSCYNTGCYGQSILYSYATLKAVLKRYTPKMIILDVEVGDFKVDQDAYDRLSFLLPYYKDHKEMRSVIESRGPFEKLKLVSSIYPFNSNILMIAGGNSEYFMKPDKDINGYKPGEGEWKGREEIDRPRPYALDNYKVNAYRFFIKDCENKHIKLFIVCSPLFDEFARPDYTISLMQRIAQNHHICFINFVYDRFFTGNNELFKDKIHLNEKGSKIYTTVVMHKIKESLQYHNLAAKGKSKSLHS